MIDAGSGGVRSAARVQGEARNTGDPSAQFQVTNPRFDQADGQAIAVQRKSEGIVVPMMMAPQNAVGGNGPWGGHDDENRNDKRMVATRGRKPYEQSLKSRTVGIPIQRWPSTTSVKRVKQRVKELTPNAACHRDLRETIAKINPVLRGWGGYFATGNASTKLNQVDSYVWARLRKLMRRRKARSLRAGEMNRWTRRAFHELGLHKLLGTIRYPGNARLPRSERPPVSRVREIRTHGLNGGLTHNRRKTEEG